MKKDFNIKPVFPNLITTANIFFGFMSLLKTSEGDYITASYFIVFAAVADALDGIVARLINSSSKFGVELDSLADVVSFGAAPAFLIYYSFLSVFNFYGILTSSLLLIFGAYRLARFNTQLVGFTKSYFVGLPIPASALAIASFVLLFNDNYTIKTELSDYAVLLTVLVSFLMISRIKYDTFPNFSKKGLKEKPFMAILVIISLPLVILTSGKALFYIFVFVILFGILRELFKKVLSFFKKK